MPKPINEGIHIVRIIDMVDCKKHHAPLGIPCFTIRKSDGHNGYYPAICNRRAISAGANGSVSETAVQMNRRKFPQKRKFNKTKAA